MILFYSLSIDIVLWRVYRCYSVALLSVLFCGRSNDIVL